MGVRLHARVTPSASDERGRGGTRARGTVSGCKHERREPIRRGLVGIGALGELRLDHQNVPIRRAHREQLHRHFAPRARAGFRSAQLALPLTNKKGTCARYM